MPSGVYPRTEEYKAKISNALKTYFSNPENRAKLSKAIMGHPPYHWKGGINLNQSAGYILVFKPDHPCAYKTGYVKRARLVLEEKLGRYLLDGMVPHHKNEIKDDDRPENLEEQPFNQHSALHRRRRVGEQVGNAKLKTALVLKIRQSCESGSASQHALARKYGVSLSTIHAIVSGRTWRHLL